MSDDRDDLIDKSKLIKVAPNAPNNMQESASILHTRINLMMKDFFKALVDAGYNKDDARNVTISSLISALAECTIGYQADPDQTATMFFQQCDKLEREAGAFLRKGMVN